MYIYVTFPGRKAGKTYEFVNLTPSNLKSTLIYFKKTFFMGTSRVFRVHI